MCTLQKCINQNNVTYVSMAIKYWGVFQNFHIFISANNEDIGQQFLPDTYDHTFMS